MLQIAIICKTFLKGGAEKQALMLANLLTEKGLQVSLVNWYGNKVDKNSLKYIEEHSFQYFPLSGNFFRKLIEFRKILKTSNVKFVFSYLTLANFVSGICRFLDSNFISIGGIRNEKLPLQKFVFERLIHNYFNNATVFNNFSAKEKFIKKGFDPEKIFVIQNAIDSKNNASFDRTGCDAIRIVSVGRFVKQKDYVTALVAFADLIKRNEGKKFIYNIVGYGPLEKRVRSLINGLGINSYVNLFINPSNISQILMKSDIFLSTSLFEGVSNSIMEAMNAGLPIVATNVGDNRYLVKDGRNGFLVTCKDVNAIVEKLEYLSAHEIIRNRFGQYSSYIIDNEFSKSKLLGDYINLISEFLDSESKSIFVKWQKDK